MVPSTTSRVSGTLLLLLFIAIAFLAFANTFQNAWTLDDFPVIVNNPDILSFGNFWQNSYPGRPLRELTFLLDFRLFGPDPKWWHLQHLFWHGLNGFLVYLLARRISGDRFVSLFTSLLFLLHPIQVEVVANISHRKDSLALAFCLASLLCYIRAAGAGRRRFGWFVCSLLLLLIGITAKENAIILPALFILYEWTLVPQESRFLLRSPKAVLGGASIFLAAALLWLLPRLGSFRTEMEPLLVKMNAVPPFDTALYFQTVLKSWALSLQNIFWPVRLAPEYIVDLPAGWFDPAVLFPVLMVAALAFGGVWLWRRSPAGFFAFGWSLLFWLPVSNLWPLSYFVADRYWYAPSVGIFLGLALVLKASISERWRWAVAALVLAFSVSLTWNQNRVWRSAESLWTRAVEVSPHSVFALNNLGIVYGKKGETAKALELFHRAAEINPSVPSPFFNLGLYYEKEGRQDRALFYFRNFLNRADISDDPTVLAGARQLRAYLEEKYGIRL